MNEKKFFVPGVLLSAAAVILAWFALPVESLVAAIVSLALNLKQKETRHVKIGVALAIIAILMAAVMLIYALWLGISQSGWVSYWLFRLIFVTEPM
ncbi:MAG: hypothetical protein IJY85_01650 [Ruminococcus sp.]|nr:hypothetical protein [Ruminococcus sp.]